MLYGVSEAGDTIVSEANHLMNVMLQNKIKHYEQVKSCVAVMLKLTKLNVLYIFFITRTLLANFMLLLFRINNKKAKNL